VKNKIILVLIVLTLFITLINCQHVDRFAQSSANAGVIDRGFANMISMSARAFGSAAEVMSLEQEYLIGRAVAARILTSYTICNKTPELTTYLNLICGAIVINSPRPDSFNGYQVVILDSGEVNAFTTPGGHIFLTRGIISIAQNEDDLAAVIAHEIAHNQLRHSIKSIKSGRMTQAVLLTATAGVGAVMGIDAEDLVDILNESVGEILQTMVNTGYSKEQEFQADIAAMYFMAAAGYNPGSLINMLKELNQVRSHVSDMNKTHPSPVQRVFYAERALTRFNLPDNSMFRQERFQQAMANF